MLIIRGSRFLHNLNKQCHVFYFCAPRWFIISITITLVKSRNSSPLNEPAIYAERMLLNRENYLNKTAEITAHRCLSYVAE